MVYSVLLTPSEAKKMIAKCLINRHEGFRRALAEGNVLLHPSTATLFIYEELTGKKPGGLWCCGAVAPRGNCISAAFEQVAAEREAGFDHKNVKYAWFFHRGKLVEDITLGECYEQMGKGDYYLKGVNVIDAEGNAGILTANYDGGTISRAKKQADLSGFEIMLLATLNKTINVSVDAAVAAARKLDGAMGINARLFKFSAGTLMTEAEAFRLMGVKATPIAAGGVNGAEGAGLFALEGTERQIEECLKLTEQCKGAALSVELAVCDTCRYEKCLYSTVNRDKDRAFSWLTMAD